MADIRLEREFKVTPERLFEVLTSYPMVLQWWGHANWSFEDEQLDFSRLGPWHATMISDEGNRYKHSGQITHINAPESIGFTWGWHDPEDNRGEESHVTFTVSETATGARLVIDHRELQNDDIAAQHERGWGMPLAQLDTLLNG